MKMNSPTWNLGFSTLRFIGPTVIWEKPFKDEVVSIPFFFFFDMFLVPFRGDPKFPTGEK